MPTDCGFRLARLRWPWFVPLVKETGSDTVVEGLPDELVNRLESVMAAFSVN